MVDTHDEWLENEFALDAEIRVSVEWSYRMDKDRYYWHVFIGELEITDHLSAEEKAWIDDHVVDAIKEMKGEYNGR